MSYWPNYPAAVCLAAACGVLGVSVARDFEYVDDANNLGQLSGIFADTASTSSSVTVSGAMLVLVEDPTMLGVTYRPGIPRWQTNAQLQRRYLGEDGIAYMLTDP